MRAEIIAVGTELLLGQIANTNAKTISEGLAGIGVDVMFHTVVGDNEERIAATIAQALERSDVVIITGGLGPTHDDLTREAIARASGRPLERRPELEEALRERFARFGRVMAETNLRQADQPQGALAIPNPRGSAPGVALVHDGKRIYAMPGVPHEMGAMFFESVLPDLAEATPGSALVSRIVRVAGIPESDLAQSLRPLIIELDESRTATIALLPSFGEVQVRITAKGANADEARAYIGPVEEEVRKILGAGVFGTDHETLEGVVARLMMERGLTLAVAESVTGGMLASRLVDVAGASRFMKAGYVAYSQQAKMRDLAVGGAVIDAHGSVSAEAAEAMAAGARQRAGTDLGLSTTGEAGPEPREANVGAVFVGISWEEGSRSRGFVAPGPRNLVRRWATLGALNLLRLWLIGEVE